MPTDRMFGLAPPGDMAPMSKSVAMWTDAGHIPVSVSDKPRDPMQALREHRFSPYDNNGGSSLAICGDDFCVIASDTRLAQGYSILSRKTSKARKLTDKCVIATGGCFTDITTLHKTLDTRIKMYKHAHGTDMSPTAVAQMLSTTLYGRRFFPFYAFNIVGGIDKDGKGAVFTYDAVGSYERVRSAAQGAGQKLMIPLLDNLMERKNRTDKGSPPTQAEVIDVVKEAFITAGERDIYTGDAIEIFVITAAGVTCELFALKKD